MKYSGSFLLFLLGLLMVTSCGGGRKIASETRPLGFIPFISENLSPDAAILNQQLQRTLVTSGSFDLILLSQTPGIADLKTLRQFKDTTISFILTGRFLKEEQQTTGGKHIPLVAYLPRNQVKVKAEILLYSREKNGWQTIREVEGVAAKKGPAQFTALDKTDPDLQISAPEYARLQQEAYNKLFYNIIKILEKEMGVPK